jgi:hypothetical protein
MPGPNSAPNGDTRIVKGHFNEEFVCATHYREYDRCNEKCKNISLRDYLAKRNMLRTGKTRL